MKIPLKLRLPNEPAVFVGREGETKCLVNAICRAPVAIIWGLGGLGKTSLAVHTIHAAFKDRVGSTVMVSLGASGSPEQVPLDIARALVSAAGLATRDWSRLTGDRDGLLELAIDVAESAGLWVILDDLHLAGPEQMPFIVSHIAKFARDARWIVTSRSDPALADIAEQTLQLGALDAEAVKALVRSLAPSLSDDEVARAVDQSAGSPWKARCGRAGHRPGAPRDGRSLRAQLPDDALPLVELLSVLEKPCPPGALASMVAVPSDATIRTLAQMGILEARGRDLRLHDVARAILATEIHDSEKTRWSRRLANELCTASDLDLVVEAVRLSARLDDIDGVVRTLDARGDDMVREGHEAELWKIVEPLGDPRLERFRLRLAVDLADPTVLLALAPPVDCSAEAQTHWARALFLTARFHEAAVSAKGAVDAAEREGNQDVAIEAALIRSQALGYAGALRDAVSALDGIRELSDAATVRADALRSQWLCLLGEFGAALELVRSLPKRALSLDDDARFEVVQATAFVLYGLGRIREAADVLRRAFHGREDSAATLFRSRLTLGWLTLTAIFLGRVDEARQMLDRLEPFARGFSVQTPFVRALDVCYRLMHGDFDGLRQRLDDLFFLARSAGNTFLVARLVALRTWYAILAADETIDTEWPSELPSPTGPEAILIPIIERQLALRRGAQSVAARPISSPPFELMNAQALWRAVAAEDRLLAGDMAHAIDLLQVAIRTAIESGDAAVEAAARSTLCAVHLVAGNDSPVAETAMELIRMGETRPSPLVANEGRFFASVAERGAFAPPVFERLAASWNSSPRAARWSQSLLGAERTLDRIDRLIVEAVRARAGNVRVASVWATDSTTAWRVGWGLDERNHRAWLPGERTIDFASRPLAWQILVVLANAGGAISKESLVREAWRATDYHPLRDDKRVQVAVRNLRMLIEDDANAPTRVITSSDGYAFGDREPVRIVRRQPAKAR
ncbi:MAG: hypothetical protein HYY84_15555 [Deltaproteobacteria bacterium]|nr:hypothetical protein [Deltaproteobacteria bacterium]